MTIQPTPITNDLRAALRGKRIGALDYGQKRIGFAVADELHILASPRGFFANVNGNAEVLKSELERAFDRERLGALIVGMPFQHDDTETPMMQEIRGFIRFLEETFSLPVYIVDEAYSSREAMRTMIHSGKKKRHRAEKGRADEVAAALILREFLRELS
ncbi:MAG: Holliday junction resolvase RuvX [Candidatus Kapabacteria bacterium]|jgi:putative Holliday junction resolvase|nr:Holliday junction resolvase RuvX [Candidatus Kapabacteria bacterium]